MGFSGQLLCPANRNQRAGHSIPVAFIDRARESKWPLPGWALCKGSFCYGSGHGGDWGPVCRTPGLHGESLKLLGGSDSEFLCFRLVSSQNPHLGGIT